MFNQQKEDEAKAEVANLRLQAIFLDEPHHTYGQKVDAELKKVRKTVDYLHNPHTEIEAREAHETQRVCMVNTTRTRFLQRERLRDVVATNDFIGEDKGDYGVPHLYLTSYLNFKLHIHMKS